VQNWLVGGNRHGIPKPYIIEFIKACVHCNYRQPRNEGEIGEQGGVPAFRQYTEVFTMPRANEGEFINSLKAQHAVRLNLIHVYRRTMPYPSRVEVYVCHCGRKFRGKAFNIDDTNDRIRQRSSEKFVGCKFLVKIICGDGEGQEIEVHVNPHHNGHEPGSQSDAYFLPVHHSAKENCAEMLSNLNNIKFALTYLRRCENVLRDRAPLHEQRTFRFFLDPVEASNLSYHLQRQERCSEDDYKVVKQKIPQWMEKKMVIFHQPYNPDDPNSEKHPFVLVMQTEGMLERAKAITPNSAWVIDSTFKTNQWNMPLYAGMCPNAHGLGMPIFLMLCSADNETSEEQTALYLTMKAVFLNMGNIRPNAIVIDKSQTEFIAVTQAVCEDAWCWENQDVGGIQMRCHLLLCWFHAEKAWVEHLLPKLPKVERGDLYKAMCSILDLTTKEQFDAAYRRFKVTYANNNRILKYVEKGWIGNNSQWRRMWPRWSRMFRQGM
jgi:hypothetical protein